MVPDVFWSNTMAKINRVTPCFWFDTQAEQAVAFYTSVFPNSKTTKVTYYGEAGKEIHKRPPGSVLVIAFELDGQSFTALNGGPQFKFNEAVSLMVDCADQKEVDYYWEKLGAGGDPKAQQCGWLKDKFGVSWQIVPRGILDLVGDPKSEKSQRAMAAMMQMKKLDMVAL